MKHMLEEYKDLSANMRHYANIRFAQLTIFIAITGGIIKGLMDSLPSSPFGLVLPVIGICIAAMFWVMEERNQDSLKDFERRARDLETSLGYRQYTNRRTATCLSLTNATRIIYAGAIVLWTWVAPDRRVKILEIILLFLGALVTWVSIGRIRKKVRVVVALVLLAAFILVVIELAYRFFEKWVGVDVVLPLTILMPICVIMELAYKYSEDKWRTMLKKQWSKWCVNSDCKGHAGR